MTVLLVVVTFVVFIAIDMVLNRKKAPLLAPSLESAAQPAGILEEILSGFRVPALLRYHPGHTWLLRERKNVERVGADELAAILAGPVDRVELPKPGHWIRQGQKAISLYRGEEKIEMVSPVEGEVVEVNPEIAAHPELLREDPYGKGWLMTVFSPDEEGPARNLLPANLLGAWMKEAAEAFYRLQPQLAGATAADGGRPSKDATAAMPVEDWKRAAHVLLLS
ncbi:MAG: glycine cleavage system protein H [Candidatus Solibacter usitatus]|nr:glycine cleavage system protein H [Candidatus Solibacter usitatus]